MIYSTEMNSLKTENIGRIEMKKWLENKAWIFERHNEKMLVYDGGVLKN